MLAFMALALLNGMVIGTSRAINGQLSTIAGAFKASLCNHVVGFALLGLIVVAVGGVALDIGTIPLPAWLGGLFGALFVAVNSYVFPRLGATKAALLVISGQVISAVALDWLIRGTAPGLLRCLGVVVVLFGIYLSRRSGLARKKERGNV